MGNDGEVTFFIYFKVTKYENDFYLMVIIEVF